VRLLGLIPARGHSKGVPDKNLRLLAGQPLIKWTFDTAISSGVLDRVVLSTDDERIADIGRAMGLEVPFKRPAFLATDEAPMVDVVRHALAELDHAGYSPDAVMLLQPTSPLRRPEHIRAACEALDGADSVCSVVNVPPALRPHYLMRIDEGGYLKHFLAEGAALSRRQDAPAAYSRDGTIYLVRRQVVLEERNLYGEKCVPLLIDLEDSLSIDEPADWTEAERRLTIRSSTPGSHS
jgi:CMP-N,N'-diacetyllegionaminic acid synthase